MSTRASIIIKDKYSTLYFYRHSDGYPECTGDSLKEFVKGYTSGAMRNNPSQSAGWLVLKGHVEYGGATLVPNLDDRFSGWKVGAYEPTDQIHGDVEFVYIIDLDKMCLEIRKSNWRGEDEPTIEATKLISTFDFRGEEL